ncbi:alpha/beta hydrolase [uncultured Roseibium sp.]|uniref:alpha/beta fold hydrolase n=1 Tax=uncultured Roseibium sp. TaxID=1936171 RepID=UPI0025913CB7|nr:alpha/beta hydrolase [uncultured Roseibium sp.]
MDIQALIFFLAALPAVLLLYTLVRSRRIAGKLAPEGELKTVGGVRFHYHYRKSSSGSESRPVLVFIHGASGNALDQKIAFEGRFGEDHDLLFVDRPGLGHSSRKTPDHNDPIEQARSIGALLDALGISSCFVVGHSLGAAVTAALALERSDLVRGLAFVAAATHPWPGGVNWYYRVAALPVLGPVFCWTLTLPVGELLARKSITHVFAPEQVPPNYAAEIGLHLLFRPHSFRANAQDVANLKRNLSRQSERYGEIDQPALVVTGTDDNVVWPSIHSDGLMRDLVNARLLVLEGAGHMPHHTHSGQIAAEIRDMMADLLVGEDMHSASGPSGAQNGLVR